jgi:hypothetical protein
MRRRLLEVDEPEVELTVYRYRGTRLAVGEFGHGTMPPGLVCEAVSKALRNRTRANLA